MNALFNGRREHSALAAARALHYGDGVFRTALVIDGRVIDLERQLAKLASDADLLGIDPRTARGCGADARALARASGRAVIKMVLWRKAIARGYRPATRTAERLVICGELPEIPSAAWSRGVMVFRSPLALASQPRLAGIKHLNRLEQVLASADWPHGVDESIVCDAAGRPIAGTKSNLFWITRGRLYTPQLDACGVAGVMRQKVLEVAQRLGLPWRIGHFSWRELARSEEVFLTNSLIGMWPVRRCDALSWGAPGPITAALSAQLAHPWAGA